MKKHFKNITQWFSVHLCGSLCHKKDILSQSCTNLTKQSLIIFFISAVSFNPQTLDDYLKIAAENNPGLKSKFYSYQASLEKINQVGSLPDPQLSFGYFIEPMERYMGNQVADISLMQMFPWFGTLGSAEEEAALMAKTKYELFIDAKSMLFFDVKSTWYELYLLQEEIKITEENLEILKTLERLAINRLKSGGTSQTNSSKSSVMKSEQLSSSSNTLSGMSMSNNSTSSMPVSGKSNMSSMSTMSSDNSMIDVLRIQLEINELENQLKLLNDSVKTLLVRFNNLLNRPNDEFVNLPDTISIAQLPLAISEIPNSIRTQNPMLRMLQKEEEAFIAQEEMNRKMSYPMIGLGLQYSIFQQRPGSLMEANNMIMPMTTISIPIWRGKYDGAIEESKIRQYEIGQQKRDAINQLTNKYEDVLKNFKDAERRIDLYKKQTSIAKQTLDLMIVQYSTSGTQFEEILKIQQQLFDYHLKSVKAVVDRNLSVAMIDRLIGR